MAADQRTGMPECIAPAPSERRLIASGVRRGNGPLITNTLSAADIAAHRAASYVRRSVKAA